MTCCNTLGHGVDFTLRRRSMVAMSRILRRTATAAMAASTAPSTAYIGVFWASPM